MRLRIGCSGWSYDDWRGPFYARDAEPGRYLEAYARVFRFVEVDGTFYRAPTAADAERWVRATPEGFLFSPKLPRAITHDAKLRQVDHAVDAFLEALTPVRRAGKLGPCVLQLPPSFKFDVDLDALREFLSEWPSSVLLTVELRHASWWRDETYDALRERGAILCWSLNEYGRTPYVRTADAVYARLIGDRALDANGGRWDTVQRDMWPEVERLREELARVRGVASDAFVIANNHFMGFAPASCQQVAQALGEPAFDLAAAARVRGQRGLADFG